MSRSIFGLVSAVVLLSGAGPASGLVADGLCEGDFNRDGVVTIDEVITSVNHVLYGCVASTPTRGPEPTPTASPTPDTSVECKSSTLTVAQGTTVTCLSTTTDPLGGCRTVRLDPTCSPRRACAPATASCSCVGGPLGGVSGACSFMTIPGGISCHGICTGSCTITIGTD